MAWEDNQLVRIETGRVRDGRDRIENAWAGLLVGRLSSAMSG